VREQTQEGVATVKKPVYSGLFVSAMNDAGLVEVVGKALQGGASGVSLFSIDGMNEAKWRAFRTVAERGVRD
jgi:hypothetical protein